MKNGEKMKLIHPPQKELTISAPFKKWFNDSVVVDENNNYLSTRELIVIAHRKGATNQEIANLLDISKAIISKTLSTANEQSRATKYKYTVNQRAEAVQKYINGKNTIEISKEMDIPVSTIWRWVKTAGIMRDSKESQGVNKDDISVAIALYNNGMSSLQIAQKFGYAKSTILHWLRNFGVARRTISESMGTTPEQINKALKMYNDGFGAKTIAKALEVSSTTIYGWLRNNSIKIRNRSESQSIRAEQGRQPIRGVRSIVKTRFGDIRADSVFEAVRIQQLEAQNVKRIIRASRIPFGDKFYTPDLLVEYQNGNIIVEEIKPLFQIKNQEVLNKKKAAKEFYGDDIEYRIVTEEIIGEEGFQNIDKSKLKFFDEKDKSRFNRALNTARSQIKSVPCPQYFKSFCHSLPSS